MIYSKRYLKTYQEVRQWFNDHPSAYYAVDTETTALEYYKQELLGIGFAIPGHACYIEIFTTEDRIETLEFLRHIFETQITHIIMHNAPFDLAMLYKEGVLLQDKKVFCTMTASHLLNENEPCGLKYLAGKYLGITNAHTYLQASKDGFHTDKFIEYATNDPIWTLELFKIFKPRLTQDNLDNLFYNIEMPFQYVLRDLKINGILMDRNRLQELTDWVNKELFRLTKELCEIIGIQYTVQTVMFGNSTIHPSMNFGSPKQLGDLLVNKLKLPIKAKTDKGDVCTDKATLERWKDKHPFVAKLLEYRHYESMRNKFIEKMPNFIDEDGRLRTDFNNCIAVTGRLSSSSPPLQNIPIKGIMGKYIRSVFIAPEGKSLICADFGGQELRILADESRDTILIDAFMNNKDLHLKTANNMYGLGLSEEDITETSPQYAEIKKKYYDKRDIGKNGINFPIIYGTSSFGVSRNLHITKDKAQKFIDSFFETYPGVQPAIARCHKFLRLHGFVLNKSGRRRRIKFIDDHALRQAYNYRIQGTAADMLRACMNQLRVLCYKKTEWGLTMVLTVHDEVVFECKDEYVQEAIQLIKHIMENTYTLCVPLIVECGYGKNYSEAK